VSRLLYSAEGRRIHDRAVIAAEMRHRLPYLIWSYDYSHASAGPKALHRLCHELNEAGQEAYIGNGYATNPEWNTPNRATPRGGDWCAVYPEVVSGNPWNAPHVARWVLNVPGLLGGDATYDPAEAVFSWSPIFLDDAPILFLPTIETDIYTDRGETREGELFYFGKAGQGDTNGAAPVTLAMREDRYALADALNRATLLRSFDAVTGMADIALLCGCPVLMPDGRRLEPDGYREDYMAQAEASRGQLAEFIRITQAVAVPA
jgi:O-antigen biosynthesis protein